MTGVATETVTCLHCGKPTPKKTYATKYCPGCAPWDRAPDAKPSVAKLLQEAPLMTVVEATKTVRAEPVGEFDSKTEAKYAEQLEAYRLTGSILAWVHKPPKLCLAKNTTYAPDFLVVVSQNVWEYVEVKGSWKAPHQEDSRVKIKVAAAMYPAFRFVAVTPIKRRDGGGWKRENIPTGQDR